jgi:capsular exopolysaccharide synthesis family protein
MELRDYLSVIRARRWVIIQAVVVVAATAVLVSLMQPPVYVGEARVLISERDTGAALFGTVLPEISSQPERGLQTQVQLMQLRPLAEGAIRKLGLEMSPEALLRSVTVSAIGQTNVVTIQASAGTAEQAAAIANAMAEEYVAWSRTLKRTSIKNAADEVEFSLDDAREQILELGRKIQQEGRSDELEAELSILTGTYTTLAEKLAQLRINEQLEVGSGSVVSPAIRNLRPASPRPIRNGLLGLGVGLVLGLGMAFLYEYLDDTIKSTEEAERIYGAPVLGIIPSEKYEKGVKRKISIIDAPGSPTAEAYRVLRNSIDFVNFEHTLKALLVTSATPGEGKSTVSANLAVSLAQAGKKVVLLSSDFRRPTTEQFFAVNTLIGLSDVLLGTHSLKSAVQRPLGEHLLVLTSGKMPPNPSELLSSTKMRELIEELGQWADWIIIDSPPILAVADPVAISRWADGVLVVSKAGHSRKDAASRAVELLQKVGARLAGVAVWGLDETKNRPGYGYGYGYYTGGYYAGSYAGAVTSSPTKRAGAISAVTDDSWAPEPSLGRRIAGVLGKVLTAGLSFLVVVAISLTVAYFLDQYFDWGLGRQLIEFAPLLP